LKTLEVIGFFYPVFDPLFEGVFTLGVIKTNPWSVHPKMKIKSLITNPHAVPTP